VLPCTQLDEGEHVLTATKRYRAETVGSLLQPALLLETRKAFSDGTATKAELTKVEDEAVLAAIQLQESVGLDVITDGEMRRSGWSLTRPFLQGLETREGRSSYPATVVEAPGRFSGTGTFAAVVEKIRPVEGTHPGEEFPFLKKNATSPTKYTIAAPSYHRRYWSDTISTAAYENCEAYLADVRDWIHSIGVWLVEQGCDYLQLDAPNYGSLCDPENRAWHASQGHDLDAEIAFDAALDSSVFEGLDVTRALHVCRGNGGAGQWHSSGGYATIAEPLFPNLDVDVVLLEYDSDRAGDFGPISLVKPGTVAVLGMLTTKEAPLENEKLIETRLEEAATHKPLEELAISTQCGFASAANAPMTTDEQRAKLELVATVAHHTWG
jgi:5-methyltetrahydropteroyltriglutamate--homocysteine methyltransferase